MPLMSINESESPDMKGSKLEEEKGNYNEEINKSNRYRVESK
jgi:hypothetical protein